MSFLSTVTIDLAGEAQKQQLSYADKGVEEYVQDVLSAIFVVALLSVLIFLVWGAMEWIFSGGEKSKVETARGKITGAIMGLIILAASLALFGLVQKFLNIDLITFI
jgi:hypothetical protein